MLIRVFAIRLKTLWILGHSQSALRRLWPGPEVIKLFSCSAQLCMKSVLLINLKLLTTANSSMRNIAEHEIFSANKYENAIVGIFILLAENFVLSWVEHEKSFYNLGARLLWALQRFIMQRAVTDQTALMLTFRKAPFLIIRVYMLYYSLVRIALAIGI